jgi:nucleoside-diphosphate-sugar epimerase
MKNILITGGSGFLGTHFIKMTQDKFNLSLILRKVVEPYISCKSYITSDLLYTEHLHHAFKGVDCFVHFAAIAHKKITDANFYELSYRNFNTHVTLSLAEQASRAGVKRFIFISTIGVNGVSNNSPFTSFDTPSPIDDYSLSKYEAEIGLKKIAESTGMEVVIIRPPLVYGNNAPGNFASLLKLVDTKIPLPFGAINNQRSFVAIDNLIDLIVTCIEHPNAANQTFLVSDDENISTSNLLKKLTIAAGKKPLLLPVPVSCLKFLAAIFGKKTTVKKFTSSLTVNIENTKKTLNWKPPISLDEGIRRCFK